MNIRDLRRRHFLTFLGNKMNLHRNWPLKAWVLCMISGIHPWSRT